MFIQLAKKHKFLMCITLCIICVFFVITLTKALDLNFNQDFNTFTNGNLDAQGKWTSSNVSIGTTNCMSGKCIYVKGASSVYAYYDPGVDLFSVGDTISFLAYWTNATPSSQNFNIYSKEDEAKGGIPMLLNLLCGIKAINGTIYFNNIVQSTFSSATYFYTEIQMDNFQEKCRYRLNNSAWSSWIDYYTKVGDDSQKGQIIEITGDNQGSYYDNIYVYKSNEHVQKDLNNFYIQLVLLISLTIILLLTLIMILKIFQ